MKKKFAVIGIGQFGFNISKTLANLGAEVLALDISAEKINLIEDFVTSSYILDVMDEKALKETGIESVDTAIVSIGENIEANLIVVMLLIEIGIKNIVAKAINPLHKKILQKVGVKTIVNPEEEMAIKLSNSLMIENLLEEIHLSDEASIFQIKAPEHMFNKTLISLNLRKKYKITVLGIKRKENIILNPSADDVIKEDDTIIILSNTKDVVQLLKG